MTPFSKFTRASLVLILLTVTLFFISNTSVLAQALVNFDSFDLKKEKIKDKKKDFKDQLDLKGTFTLGLGRDIDPVNEEVTVTIEGLDGTIVFTQTIPPGSFKQKKDKPGKREFEFKRKGKGKKKIKGQLDKIKIKEKKGGRFDFHIKGKKLQFECCLSTTIIFTIGDDVGGFDTDFDGQIPVAPPLVKITDPPNLSLFNTSSINVSGTVDDETATVVVNGIEATVTPGGSATFTAEVEIREGNNTITAVAKDGAGNVRTASIQVTLDTTPPRVVIDSPPDGFVTSDSSTTVTGMINDIVVGTVNGEQAQVTVNGIPAQVANRSFVVEAVPLSPGPNIITAVGTDKAGNTATTSITVKFEEIIGEPQIKLISGNNQTGPIGSQLPNPLVVALTDGAGNPAPGKTVIFKVMENNGILSGSPDEVRALAIPTDAQGLAEVRWTLGTRAGAGNNMVDVTAVSFTGMAIFTATALPSTAAKINIDAGNNQTGVVGEPLPSPFVAVVTDVGHNRLANVPVIFTLNQGGGNFNGQPNLTVNTDSDGRALAILTLGLQEGIENNVVEATFPGNPVAPASFVASGKTAGDPADTLISGVVLDNTDQPVPGVTLKIEGTALSTQSDAEGQFVIQPAPVGHVKLIADGSTAQRPGTWPSLEYDLVTISGQDNTIGMPIYLLPLDLPNALVVDETNGGTLTLPEVPGFSLTIAAGSATFPDSSKSGVVSVTVVHADKIPMVPNFGQQPRFIVTIQPAGVLFDPPAPITLPNVDGLAPGEVTEMYSFDHDLGQFVSIGTGTVSEDGTIIASDPGVGIIKGGWHCGGNPVQTGSCCNCKKCKRCQGNTCVNDDQQDVGECKTCANGEAQNSNEGGSCNDEKFCTSFDGTDPGPDQCESGTCKGEDIADKPLENLGEENFELPGVVNALESFIGKFGVVGTPVAGGQIKISLNKVDICCEELTDIVEAKKGDVTGKITLGVEDAPLFAVPVPKFLKEFDVEIGIFGSLVGFAEAGVSAENGECKPDETIWSGKATLGTDKAQIDAKLVAPFKLGEFVATVATGLSGTGVAKESQLRVTAKWGGLTFKISVLLDFLNEQIPIVEVDLQVVEPVKIFDDTFDLGVI